MDGRTDGRTDRQTSISLHRSEDTNAEIDLTASDLNLIIMRWDLVEWLERCASILMITSSNPSSGSELTFRSDLLLTARGGST
jgi:hypothetical protein